MTLPTRGEIAEIICKACEPTVSCAMAHALYLADALLARLRPAWEQIIHERDEARRTCDKLRRLEWFTDLEALRADLTEERKIVDRVWKALGVETYEAARGKNIDALVADLRADLRACAEALEKVDRDICALTSGDVRTKLVQDVGTALARPGVREALK